MIKRKFITGKEFERCFFFKSMYKDTSQIYGGSADELSEKLSQALDQ